MPLIFSSGVPQFKTPPCRCRCRCRSPLAVVFGRHSTRSDVLLTGFFLMRLVWRFPARAERPQPYLNTFYRAHTPSPSEMRTYSIIGTPRQRDQHKKNKKKNVWTGKVNQNISFSSRPVPKTYEMVGTMFAIFRQSMDRVSG